MNKRILIPISNGFPVRNLLRTDFLEKIIQSGATLILLCPKDKIEFYKREFGQGSMVSQIIFDKLAPLHNTRMEKIFRFIESASIATNETRIVHFYHLFRRNTQTRLIVRFWFFSLRRFFWYLGHISIWKNIVRFFYKIIASDANGKLIEKYTPDLVFCPTLIYGGEFSVLLSAKKRNINTLGMIASWDNFYSKTFLRVMPDRLLVSSNILKEQACHFARYSKKKVEVVGVPQYDRYFGEKPPLSRDDFIKSIGGDPLKKLIVFAYSGKIGVDVDNDMLKILHQIIVENDLYKTTQVLVRPYPKLDFSVGTVEKVKKEYGFLVHRAVRKVGESSASWEFDKQGLNLQHNTLAHADLIITMYSTFFVEGAVFNKPLIAIGFDGRVPHNRWNTVANFFNWDHLRDLERCGGIDIVRSKEEFAKGIKDGLNNPQGLSLGRRKIVEEQCVFTDGNSAIRIANTVISSLFSSVTE